MRKTFIYMAVAVFLGSISGIILYNKYDKKELLLQNNMAYALQEGVYDSKAEVKKNTKDINPKLIVNKNNKYYVYVGISKSLEGIKKIGEIYKKKGYSISQKDLSIRNEDFLTNLEQYDILLKGADTTNDILTIEEVVLSNYEESSKS